jgi:hypothetical protein
MKHFWIGFEKKGNATPAKLPILGRGGKLLALGALGGTAGTYLKMSDKAAPPQGY